MGTITHLKTGSTVTEYSFDAWGRRRDKDDWTYTLTSEPALFADRGFTGHEHLSWFNLYNMNGRLYDPLVGRFLNVDNVIQDPTFTQNYNRYSYCLNNPLKFTDPSGNRMIWNRHTQSYERVADDSGGGSTDYWGGGGYGAPGQGQNGTGLNGFYYDWYSGTMRSTDAGNVAVGWGYAQSNVAQFGAPYKYGIIGGWSNEEKDGYYSNIHPIYGWYQAQEPSLTPVATGQGGLDWTFYTGAVLTAAENSLYSKEFGTWMGKDFKFRSQSWGGNGVTGGKNAFAKNWSGNVGLLGKALGAYSMYGSYNKWEKGEINNELFGGDMVSGLAGIFGGIYGASWSIGWELGKNYGPSKWFTPKTQESIILEYLKANKIEY